MIKHPYVFKYFKMKEFACPCCGENKIDPTLVFYLDDLRLVLREPIIVTSGYRCMSRNMAVGGVVDSLHMKGKAVDFRFNKPMTAERRYTILREIMCNNYFKGIGIYEDFFHLDSRCVGTCWVGK